MTVHRRKLNRIVAIMLAVLLLSLLASCGKAPDDGGDGAPVEAAEGISTAEELQAFLTSGVGDTATLAKSIAMGEEMLTLSSERGRVTLECGGYTVSGEGDCVIRLGDGAELVMKDAAVTAKYVGIGCLGDASLGGDVAITAEGNALEARGGLTILKGSAIKLVSAAGIGVSAVSMGLEEGAELNANGQMGGAETTGAEGILLCEGATLEAETGSNYFALKTLGTLTMKEGSKLAVNNGGEYHGAEISALALEGAVTIEADGGEKGVGLFIMELEEDSFCLGHCAPEARTEAGDGTLTFCADENELRSAIAASSGEGGE